MFLLVVERNRETSFVCVCLRVCVYYFLPLALPFLCWNLSLFTFFLNFRFSWKHINAYNQDVHSRFRTTSHQDITPRFNERFLLSLTACKRCLVLDDELNLLPITRHHVNIEPVQVGFLRCLSFLLFSFSLSPVFAITVPSLLLQAQAHSSLSFFIHSPNASLFWMHSFSGAVLRSLMIFWNAHWPLLDGRHLTITSVLLTGKSQKNWQTSNPLWRTKPFWGK